MQAPETHILQTWTDNAAPWIKAIADEEIASRKLVTNAAIVAAVRQHNPATVWDVGCGEGWLCRELATYSISCHGTDAIPQLVAHARQLGQASYAEASYQDIVSGSYQPQQVYDVVVINFALFGHELVQQLLQCLAAFLKPMGRLVIQTLHPYAAIGPDKPYETGWRPGSWDGFSQQFCNPAPWYYRTMSSWLQLLADSGYYLASMQEPVHPQTGLPASLILHAAPKHQG